jgi:hypothetical protein
MLILLVKKNYNGISSIKHTHIYIAIGQIGVDGAREDVNSEDPAVAAWFNQSQWWGWSNRWGGPLCIDDEVISPPVSTGRTLVLAGEPNTEVLVIEIDVDYTRSDVKTDVFDT